MRFLQNREGSTMTDFLTTLLWGTEDEFVNLMDSITGPEGESYKGAEYTDQIKYLTEGCFLFDNRLMAGYKVERISDQGNGVIIITLSNIHGTLTMSYQGMIRALGRGEMMIRK
jgi:hypothetical protein